jgi:hypothetical protein
VRHGADNRLGVRAHGAPDSQKRGAFARANAFGRYEDALLMWMFWVCSWLNIWLLSRWAFGRQR